MNSTITLSERTFHLLSRRAEQVKRPPTELAEEILLEQLSPSHPYIDMVQTISGSRAVIKGTRIPISVIVGYLQAGETPETLANEVLPHVPLAAIYDALSYYHDHKDEIDKERAENSEEAGRQYLRDRLGEEGYKRITGQNK